MQKITFNSLLSYTPIISTFIFICTDLSQVLRIIQTGTSYSHSLYGWAGVIISLVLYATFFKIKTPNEHIAFWCTIANLTVVILLFGTVVYFR